MQNLALAAFAAASLILTASSPALACACCGTYQVTGVASYDVLNVRSGPSVAYTRVGEIPPDTGCVIRTGPCHGNWCKIAYASTKGWVNTKYLRYMK